MGQSGRDKEVKLGHHYFHRLLFFYFLLLTISFGYYSRILPEKANCFAVQEFSVIYKSFCFMVFNLSNWESHRCDTSCTDSLVYSRATRLGKICHFAECSATFKYLKVLFKYEDVTACFIRLIHNSHTLLYNAALLYC